jgi:hypothetical protein
MTSRVQAGSRRRTQRGRIYLVESGLPYDITQSTQRGQIYLADLFEGSKEFVK